MTKLTKNLIVTFASLFMVFSFSACDLSSSSGSSSAELDSEVQDRLAGVQEQAAQQTAAKSSSSSSTSAPSSGGGSGGFLWKPKSESDGRLVVLLPASLRGKVSGCSVNGENGRFAGDTHNGRRPHYRFSKAGGGYGSNIKVVARTTSGNRTWTVPNGSSRYTN